MELFDLTGKVAIVTGGNGGIGYAIAEGLAQAGASIVIAARNVAKGREATDRLRDAGFFASFLAADIASERECRAMVDAAAEIFGGVDILVNNAGIHVANAAATMTLDQWDADMKVNLTGAFLCSQAAHRHFLARGGGKIVNISSVGSFLGQPYAPNYAASKGGLVSMTKALAVEWAETGIQVNAILPGLVLTEMTGPGATAPEAFDRMVRQRTPAKRWGQPADLKGAAIFLASRASNFVTGATIVVDGGYTLPLY